MMREASVLSDEVWAALLDESGKASVSRPIIASRALPTLDEALTSSSWMNRNLFFERIGVVCPSPGGQKLHMTPGSSGSVGYCRLPGFGFACKRPLTFFHTHPYGSPTLSRGDVQCWSRGRVLDEVRTLAVGGRLWNDRVAVRTFTLREEGSIVLETLVRELDAALHRRMARAPSFAPVGGTVDPGRRDVVPVRPDAVEHELDDEELGIIKTYLDVEERSV